MTSANACIWLGKTYLEWPYTKNGEGK